MIKKSIKWKKENLIVVLAILSIIIVTWYLITLIIAGYLMKSSLDSPSQLFLFDHDYIPLFKIAYSLLDIQYLVKVGFNEMLAVFFMMISGLSYIEIIYILILLILFGFSILDKKYQDFCYQILTIHMVIITLFCLVAVYFGKLAFDVFYHVNLSLDQALLQSGNISLVIGCIGLIVLCFFIVKLIYKRKLFHQKKS